VSSQVWSCVIFADHTILRQLAVAHIDALQIEYSPWFTDPEQNGLIDTARELGVNVVAFSPLGKGILTGKVSASDFKEGDVRKTIPRFDEEHLSSNMRIVHEFQKLAEKKGCTSGQLALAWVIAQGAIPISGTKSPVRLTENFGATDISLSKEELAELRKLVEEAKPQGNR
jgi:aryl-alcohol dehydrogenase-like predicted oxidoreductase